MLELAVGVWTFDILSKSVFLLRAYFILVFGDIPAMSMVMRIKGHNGKCPCRMCEIIGVRIPNKPRSPYYVPLRRTHHPDVMAADSELIPSYDALHLPKRRHDRFLAQAHEVQMANTETESERLAKLYGIKGVPLLSCLSSLTFPDSFPYDFMHLVWENVLKNLVSLWTGEYKGLDSGTEDYVLDPDVWKAIGEATASAGSTIPSVYGPRPPNVQADRTACTADSWSFWALYIAPVVLRGRFRQEKYYNHFIRLIKILHTCLQFELTRAEVESVRTGLANWVTEYEGCVMQIQTCLFYSNVNFIQDILST
ncbi:hypothetical protein DAEQUDRAFT_719469 [Daedalea quercina L-15889]|uniref:Uncharacterized protein n=1 Tax=Daedalea quercina L-15889 TaxID=1314783 RepID=A0A165KPB5_9APHY|nr:hypothetical protein DAEQUDRAFT_719469 [Daedalea quercina L-15889]